MKVIVQGGRQTTKEALLKKHGVLKLHAKQKLIVLETTDNPKFIQKWHAMSL